MLSRREPHPWTDGLGAGVVHCARRCLVVAMMCPALAMTAPDERLDAMSQLLLERGLIPAESAKQPVNASLAQKFRDGASDMVITAMNFLGVPYRLGGSGGTGGFDCSGFTRHIFEMSLGLVLPRRVDDQASAAGLVEVQRDELRPGDLVFFNTLRRTFSHVGIYIGDGKFIHSPSTGSTVRVDDMRFAYWNQRFTGARRAEAPNERPAAAESATGR